MNKEKISIESASLIEFNSIEDDRGTLTSIEEKRSIPFEIKRVFYMHNVKSDRGGHSHFDTDQVVIPINGSFKVSIHDGKIQKALHWILVKLVYTFQGDSLLLYMISQ